MTRAVPVGLGERAYEVVVGSGLIDSAGKRIAPLLKRPRTVVVTDQNVADHLIGAVAEAHGNGAGHAASFRWSRRAARMASTAVWCGVSPVSTVMSACA